MREKQRRERRGAGALATRGAHGGRTISEADRSSLERGKGAWVAEHSRGTPGFEIRLFFGAFTYSAGTSSAVDEVR